MYKQQLKTAMLAGLLAGYLLSNPVLGALDSKANYTAPETHAALTLAESLIALGRDNDVSIVFPSRLLDGLPAPQLAGPTPELSTIELLNRLLSNSGLTYKIINSQVIAITPISSRTGKPDEAYLNQYLEEIAVIGQQVTGSRIRKSYLFGASPIDVISQPELAASGAQSLGEFLKFIPTVAGNSTSTAVSNGGDGTATVTLRGLPANNTLVLLNGQRTAFAGLAGDAIDLNSIPPSAVERIEILKDGASAVYGSDAIAGVINIIMRSSFDGFQLEQFYGETSRGDLETGTTNMLWGTKTETASLMIAASYFNQQGIDSRDRAVSRSADNRLRGGTDLRSSATALGRFEVGADDLAQVVTLIDGQAGTDPSDFRLATDEDLFDYPEYTSAISPSSRASLFGTGRIELTPNISAFMDASYTATKATITLAPTPLFTRFEIEPITVDQNNIYNPFGTDIIDARRRLLELGSRDQINNTQSYRFNWGLEGDDNQVRWQLNQFWSKTIAEVKNTHLLSGQRTQKALGDSSACLASLDGCVPLNIFAPNGITSAMGDYISTQNTVNGDSQLFGMSLAVDTTLAELDAGDFLGAAGIEARRESTSRKPEITQAGDFFIGGGETDETQGSRNISEMFAELQIPLAANRFWAKNLDLEVAGRISHYSDFGTAVTPKIGLRYQPNRDLMVRSTYSQGFRAPSLNEIHKSGQSTQAFLNDPCANPANVGVLQGCSQQSDPTRNQFLTVFGGSTELKPERSVNKTLGVVWSPTSLPGLYANLDLFWIDQKNVVDASAQYIVDQNSTNGAFADRVTRNQDGDIEKINATFINIGKRELNGIDLGLRYQYLLEAGLATFSINAAHLYHFKDQLDPTAPPEDLAGTFSDEASEGNGALPTWKANTGLHWQQEGLDLHYTVNFISALDEQIPKSDEARVIDQWVTHDIQINYLLALQKGLTVTLGADNLLDQAAPFAASAFNDSMDSRTHDLKGRYWYGRLSLKF